MRDDAARREADAPSTDEVINAILDFIEEEPNAYRRMLAFLKTRGWSAYDAERAFVDTRAHVGRDR